MATEAMLKALSKARDATVKRASEDAAGWEDVVADFREEFGLGWVRSAMSVAPDWDQQDPQGQAKMVARFVGSRVFKDFDSVAAGITKAVLKWLKKVELDAYLEETMNVADALQETTPEWVEVKSYTDKDEIEAATSAIIGGLPQDRLVTRAAEDLLEKIRARVTRAAIGVMGAFEADTTKVADDVDVMFDTFGKKIEGLAIAGAMWAANVARRYTNLSLGGNNGA